MPPKKKTSPTLRKAAEKLQEGNSVAALAMEERGQIVKLKKNKACPPKKSPAKATSRPTKRKTKRG